MLKAAAIVALALLTTPACAQEIISQAETFDYIGSALADINQTYVMNQSSGPMADAMELAIDQVRALRDALAGNPYVRMDGFSVGFPAGISVDFTFPEAQ